FINKNTMAMLGNIFRNIAMAINNANHLLITRIDFYHRRAGDNSLLLLHFVFTIILMPVHYPYLQGNGPPFIIFNPDSSGTFVNINARIDRPDSQAGGIRRKGYGG